MATGNKKSGDSILIKGLSGSSSSNTREKSSLLSNGLKKKAYESGGPDMGPSIIGGSSSLAFRKADNGTIGLAGISSAKSIRPQSAAA